MENNKIETYIEKIDNDILTNLFKNIEFNIIGSGYWFTQKALDIENSIIEDYEIIYIVEGEAEFIKEGKVYNLHPGNIVFFQPFDVFSAKYRYDIQTAYYYIHFDIYPNYSINKLLGFLKNNDSPVIYENESLNLARFFKQAHTEAVEKKLGYKHIISTILNYLLIIIARQTNSNDGIGLKDIATISERNIIDIATDYISKNFDKNIKINELASHLNITENYLYKVFIKTIGISPTVFINKCKMKRAISLLQSGKFSIKDISMQLGYSSQYHFSYAFKKYMSVSPSMYIENYKKMQ